MKNRCVVLAIACFIALPAFGGDQGLTGRGVHARL